MDEIGIITEDVPGAVVLRLRGAAGMWAVAELERAVDAAIARRAPLAVLEVSGLDFVASLAMGQFLRLATSQRDAGGRTAAAGPSREIELALRRGRLDALIPIYPTLREALEGGAAAGAGGDRPAAR